MSLPTLSQLQETRTLEPGFCHWLFWKGAPRCSESQSFKLRGLVCTKWDVYIILMPLALSIQTSLCCFVYLGENAGEGYIWLLFLSKLASGLGTTPQLWSHAGWTQAVAAMARISCAHERPLSLTFWWRELWRPPPLLHCTSPFCFLLRRPSISPVYLLPSLFLGLLCLTSEKTPGSHRSHLLGGMLPAQGKSKFISSHALQHHGLQSVLVRCIIIETTLKNCIFICALLYPEYSWFFSVSSNWLKIYLGVLYVILKLNSQFLQ